MTPAPTSRYAGVPTAQLTLADGRTVAYFRRRFLPRLDPDAPVIEHTVRAGDRLDGLAARYLGDPELFWKIADVNRALNPDDLVPPPEAVPAGPPRRLLVPRIGG